MDYKEDLKSKLPELKKIEGFPIGSDEDILALSEPPYFTACPNPYIADFIRDHGKPYDELTDKYHREPFVGDVSEGKNDPVYNAHSYHTKVPHKAIMKYIEHYTDKGDIVLDGFCGTGMTGVAAQLLNRSAILSDLSPIACFIAYNYNFPFNINEFKGKAENLISEVEQEYSWMFETDLTLHNFSNEHEINLFGKVEEFDTKGKVNYTVWSDVFICPFCQSEYVFWDVAVNLGNNIISDEYLCPNCQAKLTKRICDRATTEYFDEALQKIVIQAKQVPVLINYTCRVKRKGKWKYERSEKLPDKSDLDLIDKISRMDLPYWYPTIELPLGYNTEQPKRSHGISHVHHFYTKRNLWVLSVLRKKIENHPMLLIWLTSSLIRTTKMYKFTLDRKMGTVSGTLYIPSLWTENVAFKLLRTKINDFSKISTANTTLGIVSTNSCTKLYLPDNSIDYVFTDPPFGGNIMYSELNFLWEAWFNVFTNSKKEAIINNVQSKGLADYNHLMLDSFKEYYRILKPKRWITVEFHNSSSKVWNGIQEGLSKAGFIIAQVSVLDKKQASFKQVTSPGSVEKDLVISAYKPTQEFENKFLRLGGENMELDFIYQFLSNQLRQPCLERTDKMLYSKMLAYYIQRGYEVSHDAKSFYSLLSKNFLEEDGFWFLPDQINSYREYKQKMKLEGLDEISKGSLMLFVTDENSALLWIYNFLFEPKTYSEIYTEFTKLSEIQGDDVPELHNLLDENFVFENEKYRRPKGDTEVCTLTDKREKSLMRTFESLLLEAKSSRKKITNIRKEALLHGFEMCYKQNRFEDIILLSNRLDRNIIENSAELSEFIEIAHIKVEGIK